MASGSVRTRWVSLQVRRQLVSAFSSRLVAPDQPAQTARLIDVGISLGKLMDADQVRALCDFTQMAATIRHSLLALDDVTYCPKLGMSGQHRPYHKQSYSQ